MMQVSSRTEYGIRCLLLLSLQEKGKTLSLSQITRQESLPRHYVEQIFLKLRRAGFIKSIRGTQGGFALSMPAAEISLGAVIRVLEGVPFTQTCSRFNRGTDCGHLTRCSIRPVWDLIADRLWNALGQISLQHLVNDEQTVTQTLARELPAIKVTHD
jgi:Rrf2 family protein